MMGRIISWSFSSSMLLLLMVMIPMRSTSTPTYRYTYCSNATTFDRGSEYQSHLTAVFNSLSSNSTTPTGFSTTSSGTIGSKDTVYGLFLCRGDQDSSSCQSCVTTATSDLRQTYCPRGKVAIIWYDECMVRYSNESFFGTMDSDLQMLFANIKNITGDRNKFMELVDQLMKNVSVKTANGGSKKKFATEIFEDINSQQKKIYALAQCTPDLSASDCQKCLRIAIGVLPVSQGGRVLQPSCNIRYETYPFFNGASSSPSLPPSPPMVAASGKKLSAGVIVAIVAPVVFVIAGLLVLGFCFFKKKAKKHDIGEDFSVSHSLQYDLGTLRYATNNFSNANKLGEGGFGVVYKGVLRDGREIAVKKLLEDSIQVEQEFTNEVALVAKLQHRNVVRLLGFCLDGEEKLLIYEYVPNKSLDYFLFDLEKKGQLSWERRYKIIVGIARGMLYIHQDCQLRIVHRDLKTSNILLDEDMNPKISDFGMARIFIANQSEGSSSRVIGTHGYMSPEYAMHGQYSLKSDVYSFGIIILEIISGKKNTSFFHEDEDLITYAWKHWREESPLEFVDPTIRDSCSIEGVTRCLHLGLLCAQESIDRRPTMATIVLTLDSYSITLPVPDQRGLIPKINRKKLDSGKTTSASSQSSSKSMFSSVNDVTITEIDVR